MAVAVAVAGDWTVMGWIVLTAAVAGTRMDWLASGLEWAVLGWLPPGLGRAKLFAAAFLGTEIAPGWLQVGIRACCLQLSNCSCGWCQMLWGWDKQ